MYVFVTGYRQERNLAQAKDATNRIFEPKGLMITYALLCNPELINAPYREIAEVTNVALGTVGKVLNELRNAGFVLARGKKNRLLVQKQKLLDRWVEVWPEKLKPKLHIGDFVAADPRWRKRIKLDEYRACWGGEIAAEKYTRYLKAEITTIYVPKQLLTQLLRKARLQRATRVQGVDGMVQIYEMFWFNKRVTDGIEVRNDLVHPILVYADLIATGDVRNREVAQKIYDEHIAKFIRED